MTDRTDITAKVGYGKPPASTRFHKGQSGNPQGRPKRRHNQPPFDTVLGQMVTICEDGVERRVTAAFFRKQVRRAVGATVPLHGWR